MEPTNQKPVIVSVPLALLLVLSLLLGWLFGYAWTNRSLIASLWLDASEQKYLTMVGKAGPVTYLVTHSDYFALETYALQYDDVLGVEVVAFPDKAAIAFKAAGSSSIAKVREATVVSDMQQQLIPMMCH